MGGGNIDLDASCLMFNGEKKLVDSVWFRQLKSKDGSIVHSGDNRTGDGDGDDEVISVNLANVPGEVETMLFTINSYEGQTFKKVKNASARLVDKTTGKELAKYNLSGEDGGDHTGMLMTKLYRKDGEWRIQAIGAPADGRTVVEILPAVQPYL
jgi:tellurium resistance protein TerZ